MAEEKKEGQPAGKKLDLGKMLSLIVLVADLAGVGGACFLMYKATLGYHQASIREPAAYEQMRKEHADGENSEPILFTMDPYVVNLAGTPRRVIKVEMTLEMLDDEGFEEVVKSGAEARDSIVTILNRKSFDDLQTIQGKLFLKDEIAVTLNQQLKKGVVKDIYFSDFIVQ